MQLSMQAPALAGAPGVGPWGEGVTQELVRTACAILMCTADTCVECVFFCAHPWLHGMVWLPGGRRCPTHSR